MLLLSNRVTQSADLGLQDDAGAALAEALPIAERAGSVRMARILAAAVGFCYWYGRWDDALVHLASIDPEFSGAESTNHADGRGAMIALHRGDRDAADAYLRAAGDVTTAAAHPLTIGLAMRAEADRDLEHALDLMSGLLSLPRPESGGDDMPYLVRLALAGGDTRTAEAAAATAQADLTADRSPRWVIAAAFCRAMIDDDAEALLAAADRYRAHGWLPYSAIALEEAAVRLAAAGDAARARDALTAAARIYAGLGASWDIRRVDARLRAYGIRRGPRSAHRRAATGWEALTPSEQHIARLVARGLSNPDIAADLYLSRRTVQAHVSAILAKLQARSRLDIIRNTAQQTGRSRS